MTTRGQEWSRIGTWYRVRRNNVARTKLFGKLARLTTQTLAERDVARGISRRDLLRLTLAAAGGTALSACSDLPPPFGEKDARVVVVGAGLAGLHCAHRLQEAGIDVSVYDGWNRVGGRVFTLRNVYPDGQVAELGGEFIDSNHVTMHALAGELGITLDDRLEDAPGTLEVWWFNGAIVPDELIVEQFSAVAPRMLADLEAADGDEDAFAALDHTSLADYLAEVVPPATYPELHELLTVAYRGEFGRETSEQSSLNLIYLIGSDEPDPFRVFGESDERYHAREGNDAFATRLADSLTRPVKLGRRLTALSQRAGLYELRFVRADGHTELVFAEHVVLAIPFTTLREVELDVPLSEEKRTIIDELAYGTNAKVVGAFRERIWRTRYDSSGSVTSDHEFQQTWDSSVGQPGEHGILTNFLGGETGVRVGDVDPEQWFTGVVTDLEALYPGIRQVYIEGSARRMHWPSAPLFKGSYTCYAPGQWEFWSLEGVREGNIHFCGEHTSPDFQGWMEGAAETGAFAAAEILNDLGVSYPPALSALLEEKLPQDTWGLGRVALSLLSRRRLLTARRRRHPVR